MRADALIRRERILSSARELFALNGHDVALDLVAEHANVGVGTFYRNFSSRAELIKAVVISLIGDISAVVDRCEASGVVPATWENFVRDLAGLNLGVFTDMQGLHQDGDIAAREAETLAKLQDFISKFQIASVIRTSVTAQELIVSIAIITRPQPEAIEKAVPSVRKHLLESYLAWTML